MAELNQKARMILDYINDRIEDGIPPSVREICADLGIKSTSTVHKYLKELEEDGYIIRGENLNRAIKMPNSSAVKVPLLGTVTAGSPILAVQDIEEYIPFRSSGGYSGKDLFALHVRGESMINVGILDGDVIIVQRTTTARNGEIVVALVEDEATVKRFYKENGHYRLQPENDTMDPIIVEQCSILGKVVSLMRFY
ncbi:MAG: transcriptional repressor LexA [Oscillospiraceae bacterium]|nr:transcriptional repressor LexA [Oscillospiraceae bacterium]